MGLWGQMVYIWRFVGYWLIPVQKACTNILHHQQPMRIKPVFSTLSPNHFSRDAEQHLSGWFIFTSSDYRYHLTMVLTSKEKVYINVKEEEQKAQELGKITLGKK